MVSLRVKVRRSLLYCLGLDFDLALQVLELSTMAEIEEDMKWYTKSNSEKVEFNIKPYEK